MKGWKVDTRIQFAALMVAILALASSLVVPELRQTFGLDPKSRPIEKSESTEKSRADMLVVYDSIFTQQSWCELWSQLVKEGLVKGGCPSAVLQWSYENVDTQSGRLNLLTGLQLRSTEPIEINYPACVTFGVTDYSGGKIEPWIHNDYIGTNLTMHADSVFSLFFRCDNAWSP